MLQINNTPVLDAHSVPIACIVDDEVSKLHALCTSLESAGFQVVTFERPEEFFDYIRIHVVQVVLIDLALYGQHDTKGLEVAKKCLIDTPEAIRICLSRHHIAGMNPAEIVESMNPSTVGSGERVFQAFGNKFSPRNVVELVQLLRAEVSCNDSVPIYVDPTLATYFRDEWVHLVGKSTSIPESSRQIIEIVKKLSRRRYLGDPNRIYLQNVGTGRSRSVVLDMQIYFGDEPRPYRSVVKIGFPELIEQECERYSTMLPLCLDHGRYPLLEGVASSRSFMGIAYGRLGLLHRDELPPTLRDELSDRSLTKRDSQEIVQSVFGSFSRKGKPQRPEQISLLSEAYRDRFRVLQKPDIIIEQFNRSIEPLIELGFCKYSSTPEHLLIQSLGSRKFDTPVTLFTTSHVNFAEYIEAVSHGDLHLDNIITPDFSRGELFFIDFAHTAKHHCFLDNIVFEFGIRYQLGDRIVRNLKSDPSILYEQLLSFENSLISPARGGSPDVQWNSSFAPLGNLIIANRGAASVLWPNEDDANYFGALALILASGLFLPLENDVKPFFRTWFSISCILNLSLFEQSQKKRNPLSINLRGYENGMPIDERIASSIDLLRNDIRSDVMKIVPRSSEVFNPVSTPKDLELELNEFRSMLGHDLPLALSRIETLVEELVNPKSKADYKLTTSIMLPGFVIGVSRSIQLPASVSSHAESLWKRIKPFIAPPFRP